MRLTVGEKRHLSRYECYWCEQRLDRSECGAIYEKCSPDVREKRRADCLLLYKPRRALGDADG